MWRRGKEGFRGGRRGSKKGGGTMGRGRGREKLFKDVFNSFVYPFGGGGGDMKGFEVEGDGV